MSVSPKEQQESQEASYLHVVIVTGDRSVYDGIAERVIAPAVQGPVTILVHHAPYLTTLEPGELAVGLEGGERQSYAIGGGFMEVSDDRVTVLADSAERAEEINVAEAEAARRRAQALMKRYRGQEEYGTYYQALRRSRARLKVARKMRRR